LKALDLISSAARLVGIVASGETLSGAESADALLILQQMIDTWQADGLKIFSENINIFPFVLGQQTYTLGTGGNFSMVRPAKIQRMGCQILSNPTQPSEIPITLLDFDGWANVRVKNISGSYPLFCYPDYGFVGNPPVMTLNFWIIPGLACNCVIYSWNPLTTFPDLATTDIIFPPAYAEALRYNVAIRLATEFPGTPLRPELVAVAASTLEALKDINLPAPVLRCDPGLSGQTSWPAYDWRSDTYILRR